MSGDVAAFIRARLDEDEAVAVAASNKGVDGNWRVAIGGLGDETVIDARGGVLVEEDTIRNGHPTHIARHDPARVLRQAEAMRRVVEEYERTLVSGRAHPGDLATAGALLALHGAVKSLAAAWSDHPEYQEGWAT